MVKKLFQFLVVQVVRPVGLLVQFAILARLLGIEGFGTFSSAYATAITLSVLSDFGQRHMVFGNYRSASSDAERVTVLRTGHRIKMAGSVLMLLTAALLGLFVLQVGWLMILAMILVAYTAPVSDISAIALRAASRPVHETYTTIIEQVFLVAALLLSATWQSPEHGLLTFGLIGALRMAFLFGIERRLLAPIYAQTKQPVVLKDLLARAGQLATAEFIAVGFIRFPLIALSSFIAAGPFAVFAGFWPFLIRGQLVLAATIQAGYRDSSSPLGKTLENHLRMFLISAGFGVVIAVMMGLLAEPFTRLYLGPDFVQYSPYAALSGLLMIGIYPEFTLRMLYQFENRTHVPLVALISALSVAVIGTLLLQITDAAALLPYTVGLAVCCFILVMGNRLFPRNKVG